MYIESLAYSYSDSAAVFAAEFEIVDQFGEVDACGFTLSLETVLSYGFDFSFMNRKPFTYSDADEIDSAVDDAVQWAEEKIKERQAFFNNLYTWRDKAGDRD